MEAKATNLYSPQSHPVQNSTEIKTPPTSSYKGMKLDKTETTHHSTAENNKADDSFPPSNLSKKNIRQTTPVTSIRKEKEGKDNNKTEQSTHTPITENKITQKKNKEANPSKTAQVLSLLIKPHIKINSNYRETLESEIKKVNKEIEELKKKKSTNITINIKKDTLKKLKERFESLEKNTQHLQEFLIDFILSLRKLHKLTEQNKGYSTEKIDRKTRLKEDSLIIDLPTGTYLEVNDLILQLKLLRFEKKDSHLLSSIGIDNLSCKFRYLTDDNQTIASSLNIENLEIQIKAEWCQALYDYVSSKDLKKTIPKIMSTLTNIVSSNPLSELWVKADNIGIELHQNSAKVLASFALNPTGMLRTYIEKLLETLIIKNLTFPLHFACDTLMVHGDINNLSLPEALVGEVFFNGKTLTKFTGLQAHCMDLAPETYPESDIEVKSLTATITDISTSGKSIFGVIFPKELTVTASGKLLHSDKDKLSVSPRLQFSGHSDSKIRKDEQTNPLYQITNAQMTDASFTQFVTPPHSTNTDNITTVVSPGNFSINMAIGPAKITPLSLSMDRNLNGSINADQVSINLDQLVNTDTDMEQIQNITGYNMTVPWYASPIFKNKQLKYSLTNPIDQGKIDLNQLELTNLEFTTNQNANRMDRFFSSVLNWFVCPLLMRYCTFSTGLRANQQEEGSSPSEREPFLNIQLGLFNTKTDLPIPADVIDPNTGSLSITNALQTTGIHMIHQEYVKQITDQFKVIKTENPVKISRALQSLVQLSTEIQATNQSGAITMMAQHWPVQPTMNMVQNLKPLPANIINDLLTIIGLFFNYKDAQPTSLILANIIKQQVKPGTFEQLFSDLKAPVSSDKLNHQLYQQLMKV